MERLVAREERVASLSVLFGILMRGFAAESGTGKERKRADSDMLNDFVGADKAIISPAGTRSAQGDGRSGKQ